MEYSHFVADYIVAFIEDSFAIVCSGGFGEEAVGKLR
jgi:hypothetical protein